MGKIMFHTSGNYFRCSQEVDLVNQNDEDIEDDGESVTIIVTEQKTSLQSRNLYSLNRPLFIGRVLTPLVMISILESVSGSEANKDDYLFASCFLKSSLCNFIRINNKGGDHVNEVIKSAFDKSVDYLGKSAVSFDTLLKFSSDINHEGDYNNDTFTQLWVMGIHIRDKYLTMRKRQLGFNMCQLEEGFCDLAIRKLCRNNRYFNTDISEKCCSTIGSYLISNESKLNSSNSVTKVGFAPNTEYFSVTIAISFFLLSLTLALFAFLRYKSRNRSK